MTTATQKANTQNEGREAKGTAVYKGKTYAVLFQGKTPHGDRAKLAFRSDHSVNFWVDSSRLDSYRMYDTAHDNATEPEKHDEPSNQLSSGEEPAFCAACGQKLH